MNVPILVVGCGNDLAGDDGAGAALIHRLIHRRPEGCEFRVCGRAPLDILEIFDAADSIVFVDAVVSGAPPGTIHLTPLPSLSVWGRSVNAITTHGFGVIEAIGLARALRRKVPRMFLVGIEADSMTLGRGLSPAVAAAVEYCDEHFEELRVIAGRGETVTLQPQLAPA